MKEKMIETEVTYTLNLGGKFYIIEHVPARVCWETGEQFFSPETVEHIQALIKEGKKPAKVIETPVYEYAWTMPDMLMDRDSENTYKFTQKQRLLRSLQYLVSALVA